MTLNDIKGNTGGNEVALIGPDALQSYLHSTRYFMRFPRDRFTANNQQSRYQKSFICEELKIYSISLSGRGSSSNKDPTRSIDDEPTTHLCYVCQTPEVLGKFDIAKAVALKIPKGPLYGQLKKGSAVTLEDGRVIQPHEVVGKSQACR